jgi:hypothetical protein
VVPKTSTTTTTAVTPTTYTPGNLNLSSGGLNPGWIAPTPFYPGGGATQNQYYWGTHPYQPGPVFDPVAYNQVPAAPTTPFGLNTRPQANWSLPATAPMGPVGPQVVGAKTTPIAPYQTSGAATNTAAQQLAYDQQVALAQGNTDLYWQIQAKIDAANNPVPVKPAAINAQALTH